MIGPATALATARSPRGELQLLLRADSSGVLDLRVNGVFVMTTAQTSSEIALAALALQASPRPATVLVGGLGLGATALTPSGVLTVWSMSRSQPLRDALGRLFAAVEVHRCAVDLNGRQEDYWVVIAAEPLGGPPGLTY